MQSRRALFFPFQHRSGHLIRPPLSIRGIKFQWSARCEEDDSHCGNLNKHCETATPWLLMIELRVRRQPKDPLAVHASRAGLKEDTLGVDHFSVYLHFPHGEAQMRLWIKMPYSVFAVSLIDARIPDSLSYSGLGSFDAEPSRHQIANRYIYFCLFIYLSIYFCILWGFVSVKQHTVRKGGKGMHSRLISHINYPGWRGEKNNISEWKSISQKMPQFICEKWEAKQRKLEANLVFRAITEGNEAASLWQII